MRAREASNSLLYEQVSPDTSVNRSITVESRLSAFVSVYMAGYKEKPDVTKGHSGTKCL